MAKKLFGGKETYKEELAEAKAVKSGRISPAGFARGEKSEGYKDEEKNIAKMGKDIKSGKVSPEAYARLADWLRTRRESGHIDRARENLRKMGYPLGGV